MNNLNIGDCLLVFEQNAVYVMLNLTRLSNNQLYNTVFQYLRNETYVRSIDFFALKSNYHVDVLKI